MGGGEVSSITENNTPSTRGLSEEKKKREVPAKLKEKKKELVSSPSGKGGEQTKTSFGMEYFS